MILKSLPLSVQRTIREPNENGVFALRTPFHFLLKVLLMLAFISSISVLFFLIKVKTYIITAAFVVCLVITGLLLYFIKHEIVIDGKNSVYYEMYSLSVSERSFKLYTNAEHALPKSYDLIISKQLNKGTFKLFDIKYAGASISEYVFLALYISTKTNWPIYEAITDARKNKRLPTDISELEFWLNNYYKNQKVITSLWDSSAVIKLLTPIFILVAIDIYF